MVLIIHKYQKNKNRLIDINQHFIFIITFINVDQFPVCHLTEKAP